MMATPDPIGWFPHRFRDAVSSNVVPGEAGPAGALAFRASAFTVAVLDDDDAGGQAEAFVLEAKGLVARRDATTRASADVAGLQIDAHGDAAGFPVVLRPTPRPPRLAEALGAAEEDKRPFLSVARAGRAEKGASVRGERTAPDAVVRRERTDAF